MVIVGWLVHLSLHLIPHTSPFTLSICFEAELICMQPTWSGNTTGEAQAGFDLTVPQRQWQVNRHFTRVYTVITSPTGVATKSWKEAGAIYGRLRVNMVDVVYVHFTVCMALHAIRLCENTSDPLVNQNQVFSLSIGWCYTYVYWEMSTTFNCFVSFYFYFL